MGSNSYFGQAGIFLIQVIFGLYVIVVMLRFLLASARADFHNPLSQFIVKITKGPLTPLRRIIPSYMRIDWATIALLFAVQATELLLITLVAAGRIPTFTGLAILTLAHLLQTLIYLYIFIIIVQIIISWVNPDTYNPATVIMYQLSEPIMQRVRNVIPPAGGFDWSPLVVLIGFNLLLILAVAPLMHAGQRLVI